MMVRTFCSYLPVYRATSLSTYDFSTLYTTLPHNLIKEKLLDLIEWTFKRALKNYGPLYLACNDRKAFFTSSDQSRYTLWSCQNVCDALSYMDKKLNKLDTLEQKVSSFDTELKKLWVFVQDQFKENKDTLSSISDRMDTLEYSLGLAQDQITQLTTDKIKMNDTLLYVQSQSMRNNLVFSGITKDPHEKPEATEFNLRKFMVDKLKIAQGIVDGFRLERVHRMGDNSNRFGATNRPRNIVAKFLQFNDRETVRRARTNLKGTNCFINEQFPKDIADRRKQLYPKMRQAIRDGKRAWLSYDTLYIDGRPVRDGAH